MCARLWCEKIVSLGGRSAHRCASFFGFCLKMVFFALVCLGNHFVILHINLYVFGAFVREKGGGVRTRKGCWNKKL